MTSEGAQGIFSRNTFLKSVHSKEKDEACFGFLKSSRNKKDLNDVTAAPLLVSLSQLPTANKNTENGGIRVLLIL